LEPFQQAALQQMTEYSFIGGPEKVYTEMQQFLDKTQVDELMITSPIFDHVARLHSYEIIGNFKNR
jgi:alkanesulfonate monooxygenase SsuD/methylene tetrahydromethanopterin reductase-like flavin-dependent oxidoreductase (luciferase family)